MITTEMDKYEKNTAFPVTVKLVIFLFKWLSHMYESYQLFYYIYMEKYRFQVKKIIECNKKKHEISGKADWCGHIITVVIRFILYWHHPFGIDSCSSSILTNIWRRSKHEAISNYSTATNSMKKSIFPQQMNELTKFISFRWCCDEKNNLCLQNTLRRYHLVLIFFPIIPPLFMDICMCNLYTTRLYSFIDRIR